MEIIPTEVCKSASNNTDINKTEFNNTNLILSGDDDCDERMRTREYFIEKLEIEILKSDYPYDKELIDEIVELIVDTVSGHLQVHR